MTTLEERAAQLSRYLVVNRKEGERQGIIVRSDDAPEWVQDVVHAVHGDLLPDDWTYATIKEAADAIEEAGENAELEADIYTRDLLDWASNYPDAIDSCDRATEEYGASFGSIMEQIQAGQLLAKSEVLNTLRAELENLNENEEGEEESE